MKLPLLRLAFYKCLVLMCVVNTITSAQVTASLAMLQSRGPEKNRVVTRQLKDVLTDLEKKYNVYFTFESSVVRGVVVTTESYNAPNVEEVLQEVLEPVHLSYQKIAPNYYSIFKEPAIDDRNKELQTNPKVDSLNNALPKETQEMSGNTAAPKYRLVPIVRVSGTITDENDNGMPGVNIIEKGTTNGTTTDAAGKFVIDVAGEGSVLSISFVGYVTEDVVVGNQTQISVKLTPDIRTLSEIVVVGYGAQEKKNLTSAINVVDTKLVADRPVTNVMQSLQGLAPNLIIQQNSAEPGTVQNINIRGIATLTSSNSPLILVDGIRVSPNVFNLINPNDIEKISVFKDASSSAIYGSEASNGVIYVLTKKGKQGEKTSVQYTGMIGMQTPTASPQAVEGWEFMTLKNEALNNSGQPLQFTPAQIQAQRARGSYPWAYDKLVNNTVPQQNHNLSVSGGNQTTSYAVSVGYLNQQSFFNGDYVDKDQQFYYRRLNIRSNISTQLSKFVRADLNLSYANSTNRNHGYVGGNGILIRDAMRQPRIYPLFDSLGNYAVAPLTSNNVFALLNLGGFDRLQGDNLLGSLNINIAPIEGLKIDINTSANYNIYNQETQRRAFRYDPKYTGAGPPQNNEQYRASWRDITTAIFATVAYERNFGDHFGKVLVGYRNDHDSFNNRVGARRYNGTALDFNYMTGGNFLQSNGNTVGGIDSYTDFGNPLLRTINSVFGRVNYGFQDRYLAEFTFRYDGSSVLAPSVRYNFYPSLSLGWRLSNEAFMSNIKDKVGDIKIRYSIGKLGNQGIPNGNGPIYLPLVSYGGGAYAFGGAPAQGAYFSSVNTNLTWENTTMSNYGIDYTIPGTKISASFDYFDREVTGMLLNPNLPSAFGLPSPTQNFGSMQSRGWEFSLNGVLQTGQITHNFNFNIADNTNKITKLGPDQIGGSNFTFINREGYPVGSYYLLQSNGLYQKWDDLKDAPAHPNAYNGTVWPGDIRYVDRNGDGKIDVNDRTIVGNPFPRYTFAFSYNTSWKNFDFQMIWQGVGQRSQYLRGDIVEAFHNNEDHAFIQHLDRWTPTNPDASYPRLTATSLTNLNNISDDNVSDYWLFDTRYLRLKNIQIGYTLPNTIVSKAHLQAVRVFIAAQNLLTFTPERFRQLGVDPEFSQFNSNVQFNNYNPIAGRNYPNAITMSAGIDIKF